MRSPLSLARTYLLLVLTMVFWGGTAVAGKLVIRDIPPITVGVLRYGTTALILAALSWGRLPDPRALDRRDRRTLLWVGLLGACLNHLFFFGGLVFAPAAHGAIIPSTTSPVWTVILGARLGGERVAPRQVVGIVLCLIGVVLVVRPEDLLSGPAATAFAGDILFLLCGVSWGIYSYISKLAMRHLSASASVTFGMGIGAFCLLPVALVERPWKAFPAAQAAAWGALAYLVIAPTLLGFLWWSVAIRQLGAGRTAVFTNLVPVCGVLLAWLVLGERLTAAQLGGGLLAVAGVLACQGPIVRADFGIRR